jgi:hypothetical protein
VGSISGSSSRVPLRPQAGGSGSDGSSSSHGTAGLSPEALAWEKVEWLAAQVAEAAASPYP